MTLQFLDSALDILLTEQELPPLVLDAVDLLELFSQDIFQ